MPLYIHVCCSFLKKDCGHLLHALVYMEITGFYGCIYAVCNTCSLFIIDFDN